MHGYAVELISMLHSSCSPALHLLLTLPSTTRKRRWKSTGVASGGAFLSSSTLVAPGVHSKLDSPPPSVRGVPTLVSICRLPENEKLKSPSESSRALLLCCTLSFCCSALRPSSSFWLFAGSELPKTKAQRRLNIAKGKGPEALTFTPSTSRDASNSVCLHTLFL
jgi:hypothetical protein